MSLVRCCAVALLRMRTKNATNIQHFRNIPTTRKRPSYNANMLSVNAQHVVRMSSACPPHAVPLRLKFAGEVEADVGEVLLCHGEDVAAVGEEYVAPLAVDCHELMFAFLE